MSERYRLLLGRCEDVLPTLESNSVDAVVTDPPYELGMMGRTWDKSGIAYSVTMWREVLRVLKPGGHLLAFGGTRTYHRMVCAIEDAGFQIRDSMVHWTYGEGFPKSLDVSKAIDSLAGAERKIVGEGRFSARRPRAVDMSGIFAGAGDHGSSLVTEPVTNDAKRWAGWGTGIKPAHEPIVWATKDLTSAIGQDSIVWESTTLLEALLWSISPVKLVEQSSKLSPSVQQEGAPVSVRWLVAALRGLSSLGVSETMAMFRSPDLGKTFWNIAWLWNSILGAVCSSANTSTTSMVSSTTTALKTLNSLLLAIIPVSIIEAARRNAGLWSAASSAAESSTAPAFGWRHIPQPSASDLAGSSIVSAIVPALASIAESLLVLPHRIEGCIAPVHATWPIGRHIKQPIPSRTNATDEFAHEPICVARAPLAESSIARQVLATGTGGLNIDACRIGSGRHFNAPTGNTGDSPTSVAPVNVSEYGGTWADGRWPANVLLSCCDADPPCPSCPVAEMDRQSGSTSSGQPRDDRGAGGIWSPSSGIPAGPQHGDVGGSSRFFYVAKPSKVQRDAGLWHLPRTSAAEMVDREEGSAGMQNPRAGAGRTSGGHNSHPTVKPLSLLQYLSRLVCPKGGTVLDMFMGSGTTGMACMLEGLHFVGIEQDESYLTIARARIAYAANLATYGGEIAKPEERPGQLSLFGDAE